MSEEKKAPSVMSPLDMEPPPTRVAAQSKTLGVSAKHHAEETIADVQHVGDTDQWLLLSKAWSDAEGWMKSTKAMYIDRVGCLVQVTTQQTDQVAEAVVFVPGVKIVNDKDGGRKLVRITNG
jgi:hypothetical protein